MDIALNPPLAGAPELRLEAYAEASARLLYAEDARPADVLAAIGVAEERWGPCSAAWELAIEGEIARGEHGLVVAFSARFAEARERLARASAGSRRESVAPRRGPPPLPVSQGSPSPPLGVVATRPETAAVDRRALARPALPFDRDAAPGAFLHETPLLPPGSFPRDTPLLPPPFPELPIRQTTLRLDSGAVPRVVLPGAEQADPAPAILLTRRKRRPAEGIRRFLARIVRRLFGWMSAR